MKGHSITKTTRNSLVFGGTLYTIVVLLWPIFMVLSQTKGDIQEQLLIISNSPTTYIVNFIVASLIAPTISFILLTIAFYIQTKKETPILNNFGAFLLGPYVTLVSIAYTTQYTLLQSFITGGKLKEAELWYFGNQDSIPYFINQLGYTFFALSALFIGYKLLFEQGLPKALGILLWISGLLSIIAFIGLIMKNEVINSITIISGLFIVPIGIIAAIWGMRLSGIKKDS